MTLTRAKANKTIAARVRPAGIRVTTSCGVLFGEACASEGLLVELELWQRYHGARVGGTRLRGWDQGALRPGE